MLSWFWTPSQPPCTSRRSRTKIKYVTKYVQREECGYDLFRVFSMFRKKTTEEPKLNSRDGDQSAPFKHTTEI